MTASNVEELFPRIVGPDGRRTTFRPAEVRRMVEAQGWRQAADGEWYWQPPRPDEQDDAQVGRRLAS